MWLKSHAPLAAADAVFVIARYVRRPPSQIGFLPQLQDVNPRARLGKFAICQSLDGENRRFFQ